MVGSLTISELAVLAPEDRMCLFPEEVGYLDDRYLLGFINNNYEAKQLKRHEVKVARVFSGSGCEYECKLLQAYNICKCVPWDHPQFRTVYRFKQNLDDDFLLVNDYELACK